MPENTIERVKLSASNVLCYHFGRLTFLWLFKFDIQKTNSNNRHSKLEISEMPMSIHDWAQRRPQCSQSGGPITCTLFIQISISLSVVSFIFELVCSSVLLFRMRDYSFCCAGRVSERKKIDSSSHPYFSENFHSLLVLSFEIRIGCIMYVQDMIIE